MIQLRFHLLLSCSIIFLLTCLNHTYAQTSCRQRDSIALASLYRSSNGDNWTRKDNWLTSRPLGEWYGVRVNANECVICLDLSGLNDCGESNRLKSGNKLRGPLPALLDSLRSIEYMDLSHGELTGSIPSLSLPVLSNLSLERNKLTGNFPTLNTPALAYIDLYDNKLSGPLPSAGNLPQLEVLNLFNNEFQGNIHNYGNPKLRFLNLKNNKLSGSIPSFQQLTSLSHLDLSDNNLGTVVPDLSAAKSLREVHMVNCGLTGSLQDWMSNLEVLDLSDNHLSGCVPSGFQKLCIRGALVELWNNPNLAVNRWADFCTTQVGLCSNNCLTVTSTADSGSGSLREAIQCANTTPGIDIIRFNIVGTGPHIIQPLTALPTVSEGVIVDGTTQPGWTLGRIVIDGSQSIARSGLDFACHSGSQVLGLVIRNFPFGNGLNFFACSNVIVGASNKGNAVYNNGYKLQRPAFVHQITVQQCDDVLIRANRISVTEQDGNPDNTPPSGAGLGLEGKRVVLGGNRFAGEGNYFGHRDAGITLYNDPDNRDCSGNPTFYQPTDYRIEGNSFGITANQTVINGAAPIVFIHKIPNVRIGNGTEAGENTLAYNKIGIAFVEEPSVLHVSRNRFICNESIALNRDGLLPPIVSSATVQQITGRASNGAIIEVYKVAASCQNVPCQGETFLGTTIADANENWTLQGPFRVSLNEGERVTASAILGGNNTTGFALCATVDGCRRRDSLALVALYKSTKGERWNKQWDLLKPMNTWTGVTLNSKGCVSGVNLYKSNLDGIIPKSVGDFTSLSNLNLSGNALSDTIPNEIVNLIYFTALSLEGNKLTGRIPPNIGNLTNLETLDLSFNSLANVIPTSIGKLTKLKSLCLHINKISGNIPSEIGNLRNLNVLCLNKNQLNGSIPVGLNNLSNLTRLAISDNDLSGTLPNLTLNKLIELFAFNNKLTGAIPSGWSQMNSLTRVYLHQNQFSGCFPEEVRSLCGRLRFSESTSQDGYNFTQNPLLPWQGDLQRFCGVQSQISATCDDGNTATFRDSIAADCRCVGTSQQTCVSFSVSISGTNSVCIGQNASITASGGVRYNWSGGIQQGVAFNPTSTQVYTVTVTNALGCTTTATHTITVNSVPNAAINTAITAVCAGQSVTLTGGGGEAFSWSTGSNNPSITVSPLTATTYALTVSSTAGCTATAARTIGVETSPAASISTNTSMLCAGEATVLTASGGVSYLWNESSSSASISIRPSTTTTYTVTITSANGCTATATRIITVNPIPNAAINPTTTTALCAGEATTLTASGGISYFWNGGSSTASVNVNPSITTAYTVTVTSAEGCTAAATRVVTVNLIPNAAINPMTTTALCTGEAITLTASGGVSYSWSGGVNLASINVKPSTTTTYTVTVTSVNGCTATAMRMITVNALPNIAISPTTAITCSGQSINLSATGGNAYQWSNGDRVGSITVSPSLPTNYTVTVTNAEGCTATATRLVNIGSSLSVSINTSSANICPGRAVTLNAAGGTTYAWSNGASDSSITLMPTSGTTYTVTVTNGLGCTGTASITLTTALLPVATIIATRSSVCLGESTVLSAAGGTNYVWSTGARNASMSVAPTSLELYTVTVTNNQQCTATASVRINVNRPATLFPLRVTHTTCGANNGAIDLTAIGGSGALTYDWSNDGAEEIDNDFEDLRDISAGTYTVTVTDINGCSVTASETVKASPVFIVTTTQDPILPCRLASVRGGATNGTTPYFFRWNNGSTAANLTGVGTGIYTVTITDRNSCTGTSSIRVTVSSAPPQVTATISNATCNEDNGIIRLNIVGNGPFDYVWDDDRKGRIVQNSSSFPNLAVGFYNVTITDVNRCTTLETFEVRNVGNVDTEGERTLYLCGGGYHIVGRDTLRREGRYELRIPGKSGCDTIRKINLVKAPTLKALQDVFGEKEGVNGLRKKYALPILKNDLIPTKYAVGIDYYVTNSRSIYSEKGGYLNFSAASNVLEIDYQNLPIPTDIDSFFYELYTPNNGCPPSRAKVILLFPGIEYPEIPRSFIPMGTDKENRIFDPRKFVLSTGDLSEADLYVYNDANGLVYKTNGRYMPWDGLDVSGELMPEGAYRYVLILKDGQEKRKGIINLFHPPK